MEKKEKKEESTKIQKIINELLKNGYEANDLKSYLKEKFYPRIEESNKLMWDEKMKEQRKNPSIFEHCNYISRPFCDVTMFISPYQTVGNYILLEAEYWETKDKIEKALKDRKNHDEKMLYMEVEFLAEHILWMALAFGIVLGQMIETTDQKGTEKIKNIIKEKGLVPYLPREQKAA
ncbi:MAG: hypothetical protein ABSH06_14400 [Thermodesulfobacteriota bacterium]|jgi:hypothetical protein